MMTRDRLGRGAFATVVVLVLFGAALRLIWLDRLPGINADEVWYGVNVEEYLAGRPYFDRTPVGNRLNPFHSGPLLLASLVAEPSFELLRVPAVLWGVLSIVLSYPLLARPLGSRVALIVTALLCVSAAAIAQSRLGWDPSGTMFCALLAMALALRDRPVAAGAAGLAALAVHPTNIFLVPMAAAAWGPFAWARFARASRPVRRVVAGTAIVAAVAGPAVAFVVARSLAHRGLFPSIEIAMGRALSPAQWIESALGLLRLTTGVTSAEAVAGASNWFVPSIAAGLILVAWTLALAVRGPRTQPNWAWWLAGGALVSAAAFHVIAGARGLQPGTERYAMSFAIPLLIVAALGIDGAWRARRSLGAALFAIAWSALLAVTIGGYFVPLARGQAAHDAYRTGLVEPKAAAFRFIHGDSAGSSLVAIFAENWWLYWPMRYLAIREPSRFVVEQLDPETLPLRHPGSGRFAYPSRPDKVYAVAFAGGAQANRLATLGRAVFSASDRAGAPILQVFLIPPDGADRLADPAPWAARPSAR